MIDCSVCFMFDSLKVYPDRGKGQHGRNPDAVPLVLGNQVCDDDQGEVQRVEDNELKVELRVEYQIMRRLSSVFGRECANA